MAKDFITINNPYNVTENNQLRFKFSCFLLRPQKFNRHSLDIYSLTTTLFKFFTTATITRVIATLCLLYDLRSRFI